MPSSDHLRIDEEGADDARFAVLTLDRAPVNALDDALKEDLIAAAHHLARQEHLRAVVITGVRHFAAGDDIKEMATLDRGHAVRGLERISEATSAIATIPVPVIAAVTGFALGGGCELALAADFRVAAEDSTWGLPEVHLGLIPGGGGTQRLPRLIGTARAKRMILLGETVSAAEALEYGLVDELAPAAEVLDRARDLATELAGRAPVAVRAAKRAIDGGIDAELAVGLRLEEALFGSVFSTHDAGEGLRSFVAHGPRRARFEGR